MKNTITVEHPTEKRKIEISQSWTFKFEGKTYAFEDANKAQKEAKKLFSKTDISRSI